MKKNQNKNSCKRHATDLLKIRKKGHKYLEFADVCVDSDNKLFIDPYLLEKLDTPWAHSAQNTISSYFTCLFTAIKNRDRKQIQYLLSYAHERSETKLGFGKGNNGNGISPEVFQIILEPLEELVHDIQTIKHVQDISLFLTDFAEDRMTDWLSNVIHYELNEFTLSQMKKHGIEPNCTRPIKTWDASECKWVDKEVPGLRFEYMGVKSNRSKNGIETHYLLLIPKQILRKNYLFSAGNYIRSVIIEYLQKTDKYTDEKGEPFSKEDIIDDLRGKNPSDHWDYDFAKSRTMENPDYLSEYRKKRGDSYFQSKLSTDDYLDKQIYGKKIK